MFIITRFLIFCANLYILTYIYLLKKNDCECSEDWRRDFIYYYSLLYIFIVVTFIIYPQIFYENFSLAVAMKIIMGLLLGVNVYCLYTYSEKIENDKSCECSKNPITKFMKAFGIFYLIILVLMYIYLIIYYTNNEFNIKTGLKKKNNKNLQNILIVEKV